MADAGDLQRARTLLLRSVLLAQRVGNRQHVAQAFEGLAAFAALNGEAQPAMRLAGAAAAVRTLIGAPLSPTERQALDERLDVAYQRLDADEAAAALRQGESWTIEQATGFALEFALARGEHVPPSITESRAAGLTRRELEVAMLVARGLTNRQVAEELVINEKTAKITCSACWRSSASTHAARSSLGHRSSAWRNRYRRESKCSRPDASARLVWRHAKRQSRFANPSAGDSSIGLLTLLAACAPTRAQAPPAPETVRIGISAELTGPNAAVYAAVYESITCTSSK